MPPSDPDLLSQAGPVAVDPLMAPTTMASLMEGTTQCKMDMRDRAHTKVVCTIGPSCSDYDTIRKLVSAGMTCARFDFTLGVRSYHQKSLENLQKAVQDTKKTVAVMLDTLGPTAIVPLAEGQSVAISSGQTITLVSDTNVKASSEVLPVEDYGLLQVIKSGDKLFLGKYLASGSDNASAILEAAEVVDKRVICKCYDDGVLEGRVTLVIANLPSCAFPTVTPFDYEELKRWDEPGLVDFISVSCTRCASDIHEVRDFLAKSKHMQEAGVLAKLESREGLRNFDEILAAADGIMLSRGDLGVAIPVEKVAHVQKCILRQCNLAAKPAIVTRLVDTMQQWPRPTRAEATDVANAVLDGADCLLLGAETVRGCFPVETVRTVLSISKEAEDAFNNLLHFKNCLKLFPVPMEKGVAVASSAVATATKTNAALIVVFTVSGLGAKQAAAFRPKMPILAVQLPTLQISRADLRWTTSGAHQARQALISYGILPVLADPATLDRKRTALSTAMSFGKSAGLIRKGDLVVVVQKIADTRTISVVTVE